jgi:hypothetical protein
MCGERTRVGGRGLRRTIAIHSHHHCGLEECRCRAQSGSDDVCFLRTCKGSDPEHVTLDLLQIRARAASPSLSSSSKWPLKSSPAQILSPLLGICVQRRVLSSLTPTQPCLAGPDASRHHCNRRPDAASQCHPGYLQIHCYQRSESTPHQPVRLCCPPMMCSDRAQEWV